MKRSGAVWKFILLGVTVLILVLIYFFTRDKYNWQETYKQKSKEPYGCFLISEMLKEQQHANFRNMGKSLVEDIRTFNVTPGHGQTYIFIGEQPMYTEPEMDTLLSFAEKGNHVFISAKFIPYYLMDTLLNSAGCGKMSYEFETTSELKENQTFNFYDKELKKQGGYSYSFKIKNETVAYNWQYIDDSYICDSTSTTIRKISYGGGLNCFTQQYGKGTVTIHTNPVMFSNMLMKEEPHFEYADKIFSYVPMKYIIWDETSKYPYFQKGDPESATPLKYILSQPALRIGWYTLLILSVLYVLFRAKRRVRVIPVVEKRVNNSLAFLQYVSKLFQKSGDHKKMAEMKMRYFIAFLHDRYNYSQDSYSRKDFYESISLRSGVDKELVKTIFSEYSVISQKSDITSFRFEDFNNLIHQFYVRCK